MYFISPKGDCASTRQNELRYDKTNKMSVHQAKTQISLGIRPVWSESSMCAQWVAKDPSFLHADREDWSDWADAQADLSLCWAHSQFVGFVVLWLKCVYDFWDRYVWAHCVDQDQNALEGAAWWRSTPIAISLIMIRVYSICHSINVLEK